MCQSQIVQKESIDQRHAPAKHIHYSIFLAAFLVPALFYQFTNIIPIYLTSLLRVVSIHILLSVHYVVYDKDNYDNKISQKQIIREKNDYLVASILHMYAQLTLQLLFPGMFFVSDTKILACLYSTAMTHVFVVEPLYYVVHRWLHIPANMKSMHGFHHMSVNPVPSTSLVQNFHEHFIYIATFGPAMLLPYFLNGYQHWMVIMAYLVWFDLANAYGHTNIKCRHWIWEHPLSPLKYLFYTPEFHLGHHFYFNSNYGLFMPVWDHLFNTYKQYKKVENLLSKQKQDFVFIGHNGGLGHFLTIPEYCFYNIYDPYRSTGLPMELEFIIMDNIAKLLRLLLMRTYEVSRYCINNQLIGRISCIMRTPIDYMSSNNYTAINKDILHVIKSNHIQYGTRCFGLGNLNKMKQLNNGGQDIVKLIKEDAYLKNKNIKIWTGDTLTAASVYQQILKIKNLQKLFFIGANGKIGKVICSILSNSKHNIQICIYTTGSYKGSVHPNITYTSNINDMMNYQHVLVGKMYRANFYKKAFAAYAKRSYMNTHSSSLSSSLSSASLLPSSSSVSSELDCVFTTAAANTTTTSASNATANAADTDSDATSVSVSVSAGMKNMYMLDYTAPFIPLFGSTKNNTNYYTLHYNNTTTSNTSNTTAAATATTAAGATGTMTSMNIHHVQIGLLKVKNNSEFLKGYFDICMGTDQNHIYPCHAGCIIHTAEDRQEHEVGEINSEDLDGMWMKAVKYGFSNNDIAIDA